ncbi:MAG: hypothetical protein EAZ53_02590 [Bacteroidetes bacterium]|nr:MAG: hypothetical protein EAZ53_02590 [Bacteroidota bacterium]
MKNLIFLSFIFLYIVSKADSTEIPYTIDDRDRLIRLETRLDDGLKAINERFDSQNDKFDARFDALQRQIDFTNNLILTLIAGMLGSLIYMWWDRRSANAPLKDDIEILQKKEKNLLKALKEYADSHPELKTIFDRAAIL